MEPVSSRGKSHVDGSVRGPVVEVFMEDFFVHADIIGRSKKGFQKLRVGDVLDKSDVYLSGLLIHFLVIPVRVANFQLPCNKIVVSVK